MKTVDLNLIPVIKKDLKANLPVILISFPHWKCKEIQDLKRAYPKLLKIMDFGKFMSSKRFPRKHQTYFMESGIEDIIIV